MGVTGLWGSCSIPSRIQLGWCALHSVAVTIWHEILTHWEQIVHGQQNFHSILISFPYFLILYH